MALTRSALRERGITEKEILDYIMEEHGNTVEAAKEKAREAADATAEKLQKDIDALQEKIDNAPKPQVDGEDWKAKYEAEVTAHSETKTTLETEFSTYKSTIEGEKTTAAQNKALRAELKAAGAKDSLIDLLLGKISKDVAKFNGDAEKGFTIENSEELIAPIKEQHADAFGTTETIDSKVKVMDLGKQAGGGSSESRPKNLQDALHDKYERK